MGVDSLFRRTLLSPLQRRVINQKQLVYGTGFYSVLTRCWGYFIHYQLCTPAIPVLFDR